MDAGSGQCGMTGRPSTTRSWQWLLSPIHFCCRPCHTPPVRKPIKYMIWGLVIAIAVTSVVIVRQRPIEVVAHAMTQGEAVQAVYATGIVEPSVSIPIAPRVAGHLVELRVDEGAQVKKGQILARLEDVNLQHAVEQLRAQESWTKQLYDRTQTVLTKGVATVAERDKTFADWQSAKAARQKAETEQKFMWLTAPADGVVMRRDGEIGQFIAVNQPLMQLAAKAPLRITADVDEEDIAKVQVGQEVIIRADAFPDQLITGKVNEMTPKGDPTTRSYRVRIGFPTDAPLRSGMTTDTNIVIERHANASLLPATAVMRDKDQQHVWVVRDGRLHKTPVKLGISGDRQVEVLSGLQPADVVVDVAIPEYVEGRRVKVSAATK